MKQNSMFRMCSK